MVANGRAPAEAKALSGPVAARNGLGAELVTEIQRARILAAMSEVACERGAGNVTVAHVVERAGVSRRTFYELFDDRDGCFVAAFEESLRRAAGRVLPAYRAEARWSERIRASLIALLEFLDTDPVMGLLLLSSPGVGAGTLERRRHVLARVIAGVDEGRVEGRADDVLPPLTAEGLVGGVLSVLHARLLDPEGESLLGLTGSLMSMIVLPYLGTVAARKELARPVPKRRTVTSLSVNGGPLRELEMRLTYRTVCVLSAVATHPGGSNRQIADESGIADQGQISKLLARLRGLGLVENTGVGSVRGAPNAWMLTAKGWELETAIAS